MGDHLTITVFMVTDESKEAGYKALFVSVDLPVLGNRLNESRNNFNFPSDMRFPVLAEGIDEMGLKDSYERGYGTIFLIFISASAINRIYRWHYSLGQDNCLATTEHEARNLA